MGKYLWRVRNTKTPQICGAHHGIILDETKRKFGYLGAEVESMRCIGFSLSDDLPLQFGKILPYRCDRMRQMNLNDTIY